MLPIVGFAIDLSGEDVLILAVPTTGPVFIGPAEAEGEVGLLGCEDVVEGAFEEAFAGEPVVVVAEAVEAVGLGEVGLGFAGFGET